MSAGTVGLYVLVWRISDEARARQVREILRFAGVPMRPGVVEIAATDTHMRQLQERIGVHLREGDLVRIYPICGGCRRRVRLFGGPELTGLPIAWII